MDMNKLIDALTNKDGSLNANPFKLAKAINEMTNGRFKELKILIDEEGIPRYAEMFGFLWKHAQDIDVSDAEKKLVLYPDFIKEYLTSETGKDTIRHFYDRVLKDNFDEGVDYQQLDATEKRSLVSYKSLTKQSKQECMVDMWVKPTNSYSPNLANRNSDQKMPSLDGPIDKVVENQTVANKSIIYRVTMHCFKRICMMRNKDLQHYFAAMERIAGIMSIIIHHFGQKTTKAGIDRLVAKYEALSLEQEQQLVNTKNELIKAKDELVNVRDELEEKQQHAANLQVEIETSRQQLRNIQCQLDRVMPDRVIQDLPTSMLEHVIVVKKDDEYIAIKGQMRHAYPRKNNLINRGYAITIHLQGTPNAVNNWNRIKSNLLCNGKITCNYSSFKLNGISHNELIETISTIDAERLNI